MQTDWTKVLGWPGYRVYHSHIDEARRLLTLRVRRKRGNRKLTCAHCGRRVYDIRAVYERKVRDLPCFEFQTAVLVECYRIRCPDCGLKAERNPHLPSKAPYSKRFEDAVGQACEGQPPGRWRAASAWPRARSGPSTCAISSAGKPDGASPHCATWGSTRSTRASASSS